MAKLTPEEIYSYARAAGFSPDQATTMTAIALAESGGETGAHATVGEDSVGLWQINREAHGDKYGDLNDPLQNAKAAFDVSGGGESISPWTVTHAGREMPYVQHQAEAQEAAAAYGDSPDLGVWTGSPGYGNTVSAGSDEGALPPVDAPPVSDLGDDGQPGFGTPGGPSAEVFVQQALAQEGDEYQWGVQADHADANPDEFDCAELVEWAAAQAGVDDLADTSYSQYVQMRDAGGEITVEQALHTRGALLFRFGTEDADGDGLPDSRHVAISLGDGTTIEAKGEKWGVGQFDAGTRFTNAAIIPGLDYGAAPIPMGMPAVAPAEQVFKIQTRLDAPPPLPPAEPAPPPPPPPLDPNSPDTDKDGLTDALEQRYHLDPTKMDTDGDNISDGYELSQYGTDPTKADSDRDGLSDANEIALGLNPLDRDSDDDGKMDSYGVLTDTTDSDADGLSDELEFMLQTMSNDIDSDDDGSTDWLEFEAGTDPLDALDNPLSAIAVGAPQPLVSMPLGGTDTNLVDDDDDDDGGDLGPLDDDTFD